MANAERNTGDLFVVDTEDGRVYRLSGSQAETTRRLLQSAARSDASPAGLPEAGSPPVLDEREAQILQLVAAGHSNESIATMLHVSVATVRRTTTAIYRSLGARNRASAIARAHELRLLT